MAVTWKGQSVLVTGVAGFLGPHLANGLVDRGARVVGVVHDLKQHSYLHIAGIDRRIDVAQGDVTDLDRMSAVIADYEVRYVFHCAADSIVKSCATNPLGCFRTNVLGSAVVLEAARQVGSVAGAMCMESDKAYGSFDENDLPYREDQPLRPRNVYEVSKACAGMIAKAYDHNYDLPTFTVRGANLYGPGDMNFSRIFPCSIMRLLNGQPPVLYEGVEHYLREFLYVEDAARTIVRLMERIDQTRGHAINLGSGEVFRVGEVISMITRMLGLNIEPEIHPKKSSFKEIEKQWLDLTKLRAFIPDFKATPLADGLTTTIEWYRDFNTQKAHQERERRPHPNGRQ